MAKRTFLDFEQPIAELDAKKADIRNTAAAFAEVSLKMDSATSKEYFLRMRRDGELSAMKWALGKCRAGENHRWTQINTDRRT